MTGLCVNTQEYHFTNYCLSFGGGWDLGKTIDTPENAAALQFIIDAYRQGYVVTPKELGVSYDGNVLMSGEDVYKRQDDSRSGPQRKNFYRASEPALG